ncbi:MAG: sensor histidine kinase [Devosia sp.]
MVDRANAEPDARSGAERQRRGGIWNQLGLRRRLLLLTAIALLPAFLIVLANHLSSRALRSAEVDAYAVKMTEVVQNEVVRGLSAAATLMIAMGRSAIVEQHDAAACEVYTASIQRDLVTILDIAVADATGRVYCHSGVLGDTEVQAGVDALAAGAPGRLVVGDYTSTSEGTALPIGVALTGADGGVDGFILLNVGMGELVHQLTAATASLQASRSTVTDRSGTVLLSLPEGHTPTGQPLPDYLKGFVDAEAPGSVRLRDPDGVSQIVGYRPATEALPIATMFELPEGPTMAPIEQAGIANSLIALAGAGVAFLLAWLIGTAFIRRPVTILNDAILARRAGDRQARTGFASDGSEFGMIGRSVDSLFDELDRRELLQQQAEEQRDLYAREVQHRVKNLLAIIQVIARQTLARPDASPEVRTFESRIGAIVRVHTKALARNEGAGDVAELVRDALTPLVKADADRIELHGPEVELRSKVAAALAMALHELATNAVKYGALSNETGQVKVDWRLDGDTFYLSWVELGGPPVTAPTRTGFGSVLIARVLQAETKGKVATEFAPEGFAFHLTASAADVLAPSEAQ